jgi:hypothetical protein
MQHHEYLYSLYSCLCTCFHVWLSLFTGMLTPINCMFQSEANGRGRESTSSVRKPTHGRKPTQSAQWTTSTSRLGGYYFRNVPIELRYNTFHRREALTADQKVWGSITTRAKANWYFLWGFFLCPSEQTRLFWWFRVVRSLLPHFPGWLSPSAESPMVGADVKRWLSHVRHTS